MEFLGSLTEFWTCSTYIHALPTLTYRGVRDCLALNKIRSFRNIGESVKAVFRLGEQPNLQRRKDYLMPVLEPKPKDGSEKIGAMVSNGSIGRRLLNVGEAAQYLGVSVDTLHKWVQLLQIPHVKAVVRCDSI